MVCRGDRLIFTGIFGIKEDSALPDHTYVAIDLKSYYASAECALRGLDPLKTNLVVADSSRTEKTICLAVSPSLKACGISGRARLFEVIQRVRDINADRLWRLRQKGIEGFSAKSFDPDALEADPTLELSFIIAPPQMSYYLKTSAKICGIYGKYVSPDDTLVYSIDEVFMDVTSYLSLYHMSAAELAKAMIREVLYETHITATAGIGSNLYLAKVAMDIVAKHMPPDKDGVRMAELDEMQFRHRLWDHRPLTDFWMTGPGTVRHLGKLGIYTMGDLAAFSIDNEDLLFREFGINAEIMIDHAWGYEPVTMNQIRRYEPSEKSVSEGQVLSEPYPYAKAVIIVREMAESLVWRLTDRSLVTDSITIDVGYDRENVDMGTYTGLVHRDHYGRLVPTPSHGSIRLLSPTNLSTDISSACVRLFSQIADHYLTVRRITITANHTEADSGFVQMDLFTDADAAAKEKRLQDGLRAVREKYGKNAVLKGTSLLDGATMKERNGQIGGHRA